MGLAEVHAYALLSPELPHRNKGAVWAFACQHLALFLDVPAAGIWAFPHACIGVGIRTALLLNGPGYEEHEVLAKHYLTCLDPSYDGSFRGSSIGGDEAVALLGAAYHLWRGGVEARPTLIGLLRTPGYAARLVAVPHMPPLPMLLMEVLARGGSGSNDPDAVQMLEQEVGDMLTALEPKSPSAKAASPDEDSGPDMAHAVAHVLTLVAKRLELRHKAAMFAEQERRKSVQAFTGKSVQEIAALTMQRSSKAFLDKIKRRQLDAKRAHLMAI